MLQDEGCIPVFNIIWFCVVFFVIIGTCSRDSKGFCDCDCCRPAIWVIWYNAWKSFGSKIGRSQDFGILGCFQSPMRDSRESTVARFCNLERGKILTWSAEGNRFRSRIPFTVTCCFVCFGNSISRVFHVSSFLRFFLDILSYISSSHLVIPPPISHYVSLQQRGF